MGLGIEDNGGPPTEQQAPVARDGELIEDVVAVTGEALGTDVEVSGDMVEAVGQELDAAHAGQEAPAGSVACHRQKRPMDGHGLGGVLDAAGGAETAVGP